MEVGIKKNCFKQIVNTGIVKEETTENIVPDALPDIMEIVDCGGTVLLRAKDCENGEVSVSGETIVRLLYVPEGEKRIQKLELTVPFKASCEMAVESGEERISASLRLGNVEAKMLNPRKVLVRTEVYVFVRCFVPEEIELGMDVKNEENLKIKSETVLAQLVSGVREKTFVLTDDFPLRSPTEDILRCDIRTDIGEIKCVGNKLIFKGTVWTDMSCMNKEGEIYPNSVSQEFSQILDIETAGDESESELSVVLTGAYVELENEGRNISVELHFVAQAITREQAELQYISDAYSGRYETVCEKKNTELETLERHIMLHENVACEFKVQAEQIAFAKAFCGKVNIENKNGESFLRTRLMAVLIYFNEENRLCRELNSIEINRKLENAEELCTADVRIGEVSAAAIGTGVAFRAVVDFGVWQYSKKELSVICGVEQGEEKDMKNCPSIILKPYRGEDFWEIAKKYNSSIEMIEAENDVENLKTGDLLVIVR